MSIVACKCNDNIKGLDHLPNHHHYERHENGKMVPEIYIWVDWKQVAHALSKLVPDEDVQIFYADNREFIKRTRVVHDVKDTWCRKCDLRRLYDGNYYKIGQPCNTCRGTRITLLGEPCSHLPHYEK